MVVEGYANVFFSIALKGAYDDVPWIILNLCSDAKVFSYNFNSCFFC